LRKFLLSTLAATAFALLTLAVQSLVSSLPARADIPQVISYQGYLTNGSGTPINAMVQVTFSLYAAATGGPAVWTEQQTLQVSGGVFNALLGTVTPIALPFNVPYFLGVKVGADAEMTPRPPVTSVPFALRAGCNPGDRVACYTGAPGTEGNGLCAAGVRSCNLQGNWGSCAGEVTPNCGANCYDLQSDPAHCGSCDTACPGGMVCTNSLCVEPPAQCGDGILQAGETCDDGNTVNGDGCSAACQVEAGYQCSGQPSVCLPIAVCGNGIKDIGEGCDDGNTVSGDGCSATCQVETGYQCSGTPSLCMPFCGDGIIAGPEQCDGMNFGGKTCQTYGFSSGTLSCTQSCTVNLSGCIQ
jgi:cysteine-rich repeat protein